jgi:hypothetical protein
MRLARISGLSTLATIAAAGSMIAMKTEASAAEAGALLPVMSCEALANSDLTALDVRIESSATATPFWDVKGYISLARLSRDIHNSFCDRLISVA